MMLIMIINSFHDAISVFRLPTILATDSAYKVFIKNICVNLITCETRNLFIRKFGFACETAYRYCI